LCGSCSGGCQTVVSPENTALVECPVCSGCGCEYCSPNGFFELTECPRTYIGQRLIEGINYATLAMKGNWPIIGGTLDQSAWFVALVQRIEAETAKIDAERMDRL